MHDRIESERLAPAGPDRSFDVAVIGGGIAGLATALRLQARGLATVVLESHRHPGGCAGFFRRGGFSFDVGATTLVDFEPGGVGGQWLDEVGLPPVDGERLPGYVAWLPDRVVTLHRDTGQWARERLRALGDTPAHRAFWALLDRLAEVFWRAAHGGARLPVRSLADAWRAARLVGAAGLPLVRYLRWTMGDALRAFGLRGEPPLTALLSMLIEDTVHATLDEAPLINAALGVTIRGAGLTRPAGGMRGFLKPVVARYRALAGHLRVNCPVRRVEGHQGAFVLHTGGEPVCARQVVSAVTAEVTAKLAGRTVAEALRPYLRRDRDRLGGACVVFLGVPDRVVRGQAYTHHQLLQDYAAPLGDGNNMFVSVSADGDRHSAPAGHRVVMISTHCELRRWKGLSDEGYVARKTDIGRRLLDFARRVYPELGTCPLLFEVGTPRTYERFTGRPGGAVGGVRQNLSNSNQYAIPHDLGGAIPGFWLVGDSTWPGLGTVACVLGSRIVAEAVAARHAGRRDAASVRSRFLCGSLPPVLRGEGRGEGSVESAI